MLDRVFLAPLLAFLVIGTVATSWQARNPERELAARLKLLSLNSAHRRLKHLALYADLRAQEDNAATIRRKALRRAVFLGSAALLVAGALVFAD